MFFIGRLLVTIEDSLEVRHLAFQLCHVIHVAEVEGVNEAVDLIDIDGEVAVRGVRCVYVDGYVRYVELRELKFLGLLEQGVDLFLCYHCFLVYRVNATIIVPLFSVEPFQGLGYTVKVIEFLFRDVDGVVPVAVAATMNDHAAVFAVYYPVAA